MTPILNWCSIREVFEVEMHHLEDSGIPDKKGIYAFYVILFGHEISIVTGLVVRYYSRKDRWPEVIENEEGRAIRHLEKLEASPTATEKQIRLAERELDKWRKRRCEYEKTVTK